MLYPAELQARISYYSLLIFGGFVNVFHVKHENFRFFAAKSIYTGLVLC